MKLSDFDYNLPQELIAQEPASPRDSCRLLVLNRESGEILHCHFFDITDYLRAGPPASLCEALRAGDLLVINNTKVFKARLLGELDGKKVEIFLVRPEESGWLALGKPGRRLRGGETVKFADNFFCKILSKNEAGELTVDFGLPTEKVIELANRYGHIPVPPYIKKEPTKTEEYQTVYAAKTGSVAAPTAGFHFTEELMEKLKKPARNASHSDAGGQGIEFAEITLHVGLGTFLPIRADEISAHKMHSEWVEISAEAAEKINAAKSAGRRVIAVGTTTTRALEGVAQLTTDHGLRTTELSSVEKNKSVVRSSLSVVRSFSGFVNLFIQPGFEFKIIDGLVTNFHLPKSTLLVMVSAFAGRENILRAYREAVAKKYRFYSFGDAMLIV